MLRHIIAIVALAALCGAWVLVQRWIGRRDPEIGLRIERRKGGCGSCSSDDEKDCSGPCA